MDIIVTCVLLFCVCLQRVVNDNVAVTTLDNRQYCIVLDPFRDGKNQLGVKEQRKVI